MVVISPSETRLSRGLLRQYMVCVCVALALFLSTSASAQLPGSQPKDFSPVIPEFDNLSADWWAGWPDAKPEQRKQWLDELDKAWREWNKNLPEEEALAKLVASVNVRIEGIRNTWAKREQLKKVGVLQDVEFPDTPSILQWAQADAAVARGRQRYNGLQLEMSQMDESVAQSLSRLRERVLELRDIGKKDVEHVAAIVSLFYAQIAHLQTLEEQRMLREQLTAWGDELKFADAELKRMLDELQYSEKADKLLQKAQTTEKDTLEELAKERSAAQNLIFETSDATVTLQEQIKIMNYSVEALANRLELRKQELLLAMNSVLQPDGDKKQELSLSKDLVPKTQSIRENLTRQLNIRQRQIVAWAGEDAKSMNKWWRQFEKVDSGLSRVGDLINDVQRYENAQLYVYQRQQGWWQTLGDQVGHQLGDLRNSWRKLANYSLFAISGQPITLRDIAQMILVIIGAWGVSRLLAWFFRRMVRRKRTSEHVAYNLERVFNYCIVLITFLIVLSMVGLDTSKLTLIAGALSVGLGFGMQAIFSNFISGIILLFEQPLRVGDLVELESGVFGRIRDINVRSTRITTRDNVDILVPNSEFVTGRVTNHTLEDPVRRIHVPFGVAYGTDPEIVREAAMLAAERVQVTFSNWQRKTEVWLTGFGDSSLDFKLVVWVNSNAVSSLGDLAAMYNLELLREFDERGIEIPFPQRDVHVRSWGSSVPELPQSQPASPSAAHTGSAGVEDWRGDDGSDDAAEGDGDAGSESGGAPGH
ncbi:mechanosensitive ion channel domain-containing protein [Microbulbifer aggregans]|uniref:mechanosensitive ion channel domain-containing protein n=1 Tax=Microbulbifer aggregans TaxID=1769779 RepID=UPI001CFEEE80|nr:mechanosensitive ion channel domain-containing protein [Microbulbifer aggregans]